MNREVLEIGQMLSEHPIISESIAYKTDYVLILEYFVIKYSLEDIWAQAVLHLYKEKLLGEKTGYEYENFELKRRAKKVVKTKFRLFRPYTYRYCLIFDCMFICAPYDRAKGEAIFEELSSIYAKRYQSRSCQVFNYLYDSDVSVDGISKIQYMRECWGKNREFCSTAPMKILVTANMSAGKSTLLNAIVGKRVNRTQSDACTAKIHYIVNKPFEDGFCYEWDYLLELNADEQTLMEDNDDNTSKSITVGTYFRTANGSLGRLWLIDTPGVNSSQDALHRQITEETIRSENVDLLIYLLNGENIGTEDDRKHLLFVAENYKGKVLFVVNKVDHFKKSEDSVSETIKAVVRDLTEIGFQEPKVVPISAYAGFLAKLCIFGERLDEDEQDEFDRLVRKLRKPEYQFDTYYPEDVCKNVHVNACDDEYALLLHSGILHLEKMICLMKEMST